MQKRERHAAQESEDLAEAERLGLPVLVGAEKQIGWAGRVRSNLIRSVYETLVEEGDLSEDEDDNQIVIPARIMDRAWWWIDNRDTDPKDLAEILADPGTVAAGATTENAA